ncbi:MAG: hypothetical protein EAZ41_00450 [Sphingobacteriia bacterium]|nr:MAG: hypothetical protein EAZ41_00450 [Sphingobacteriia bacterium]
MLLRAFKAIQNLSDMNLYAVTNESTAFYIGQIFGRILIVLGAFGFCAWVWKTQFKRTTI